MNAFLRFAGKSLLIGLSSLAASAAAGPSPFLIRYWLTPDGLPANAPTSVCQSPAGDLWIASNSGISRSDGVRFENFTARDGLPDNQVQCMFFDSKQRLWIGTRRGAAVREMGKWAAASPDLPAGSCTAVAQTRDGSLWFAIDGALWRGSGQAVTKVPEDLKVRDLVPAPDGSLWMVGYAGIRRWRNGEIQPVPALDRAVAGREVWGIAAAADGQWIVYGQDLLLRGAEGRWDDFPPGMPDADRRHLSCVAASDGSIWVATRNSGIACLKDGVWTGIDTEDGLSHDDVRFLMEDQEENIWACTNGGGLNQLRHRRVEVFGMKEGLGRQVTTALVADDAGRIWAGTDGGGLKRLDHGVFVMEMPQKIPQERFVWSLCADGGGGLWMGTFQAGLIHWQDGRRTRLGPGAGLADAWIPALLRSRGGDLWIGTHSGAIQRMRDGRLVTERGSQGPGAPLISGFLERRDGELLAATRGIGILRRSDGKWERSDEGRENRNLTINALHEDAQGRVWVGTAGRGLALWDGDFLSFWDTAQGIASNVVTQILHDSRGNLWLGTNIGLQRVSIEDLLAVAAGKRSSLLKANLYGRDDGIPLPQFSGGHGSLATAAPDGALWFSMAAGAVRVPPDTDETPKGPLPLRIESVTTDGRSLWEEEWNRPNELELESPGAPVEIRFAAPSFNNPEKLRFRYKLAGLEDSWRDTEGRRMVSFSSLPPGNYLFEVSAARPGSAWEAKTASIAVRITPKFWQSGWFLGACVAAGSIAIALLARWWSLRRIRRHLVVLEQERKLDGERTRIAQDLHDDLGATLTEINFLGVLGATHANSPATRDRLEGIVERARRMAKSLDEIVWTVNPANDSLSSTVNYLCSRAQESLASANLRCRLEVADDLPATVLDSELRHHMLMAVNEAVNNVLKHASATEARLAISYRQGALAIAIADDGRGFDPDAVPPGRNGLGNMRKRTESDGGSCVVRSRPGEGTRVTLTLPLACGNDRSRHTSTRSGS